MMEAGKRLMPGKRFGMRRRRQVCGGGTALGEGNEWTLGGSGACRVGDYS